MLLYLFLLFSHCIAMGSTNKIIQEQSGVVAEGTGISLSCEYDGSIYSIQWYRHQQKSRPEFLLYITEGGSIYPIRSDFSARINKTQKRVDLLISSAAATDSAVYYCALNAGAGTKLVFGTGTSLTIEPKEQHKPEYYILRDKDDSPKLCLATEFTRQNATMDHRLFNDTEPARNPKDHRFFSQVAFLKDGDETSCEERLDAPTCEASLEPDTMVNLATISISILRLIFIKTVVFNVLMTLRLWISQ